LDIVRAQELGVRGKRLALLKDGEAVFNDAGTEIQPRQARSPCAAELHCAASEAGASWSEHLHEVCTSCRLAQHSHQALGWWKWQCLGI